MALMADKLETLSLRRDPESGLIYIARGHDEGDEEFTLLGPALQGVLPIDEEGNRAEITDGGLHTRDAVSYLAGPRQVAVGPTSSTLITLGCPIHPDLKRIGLTPASAAIYWEQGAAATSASPLLSSIELNMTAAQAATFQFYAASPIAMVIIQEG